MANTDSGKESKITADHEIIKKWAEERGGIPSIVKGTGGAKIPGIIRFDFPKAGPSPNLEHISWDEFFKIFEDRKLALLYQERTATGELSRFNKFVSRSCLSEEK